MTLNALKPLDNSDIELYHYKNNYELFEAKYYQKPMTIQEIHREAGQFRESSVRNVIHLGFIAVNGFIEQEDGYIYYDGEDLYREII